MDRRDPPAAGQELAPLDSRGAAQRFDLGDGRELWRLSADDADRARALASGVAVRLGGFVDAGVDDDGPWLVRDATGPRLTSVRKRGEPVAHREAARIAHQLAVVLERVEEAGLEAGPFEPADIVVGDPVVWLAEGWVGAASRAAASGGSTAAALLWTPPEVDDAATWDDAARRYAVGMILYELLAGEHPFRGAGLRHALQEARDADPSPFADPIAEALPPGLQSLCLGWIARDPAERPGSARAMRRRLERVVPELSPAEGAPIVARGEVKVKRPRRDTPEPSSPRRAPAPASPPPGWRDRLSAGPARFAPLALGVAMLAAASFADRAPAPAQRDAVEVPARGPLLAAQVAAEDCASCHPRQAAEWSQSVMGHSVKSPLFNALEMLIEEQVGRDDDCPSGAGILRRADPANACRTPDGRAITGSGGEHWCVNCHAPGDNLRTQVPPWQGRPGGDPRSRRPVLSSISPVAQQGISCAFCHQVHGPVTPGGGYEGNPDWVSFLTGNRFLSRPEDRAGHFGIANSGYRLDPRELLLGAGPRGPLAKVRENGLAVHARPSDAARDYLQSSDFCGACHDVRLFGTDVIGAGVGEHFKRLRNAYSEWRTWAEGEKAAGRRPASCQDCHMSAFPGVCVPSPGAAASPECPPGSRFESRKPGHRAAGRVATSSRAPRAMSSHYFTSVDLPLAPHITPEALDPPGLDGAGVPLSLKKRRNALLRHSVALRMGEARRDGGVLRLPLEIENVGAGHKIPAGFSQEREVWVHLRVEDARGGVVYEVGRVDRNDEDLRDKVFERVNTNPDIVDGRGRPLGLFGADVRDGPDVPRWNPNPALGGDRFEGRGLINFQNGFLRCVRCIGEIDASGACQPGPGQGLHHADRYADGDYDLDTGECRSNLTGRAALLETFFPVGALDASRGGVRGPDAIIDTRSLRPGRPQRYTYVVSTQGRPGPYRVRAKLMFRSFPPFLVKAFAAYEAAQARRGRRPDGPLVTPDALARLERIELSAAELIVP